MGFRTYKDRLIKSAKSLYKKWDIYAKDLTLTFEGEDKHMTYVGATLTIIIMGFMVIYSGFQLETMIKRQSTTVNIKNTYVDLTKDYANISLSDLGFDFAVQVYVDGEPFYDETYFEYDVKNINSYWAPNEEGVATRYRQENQLSMELWTNYNASQAEIERLGINQKFLCPKEKDYTIGGAYSAPNYRYIDFRILKWNYNKRTDCKSDEEINTLLDGARVTMFYNNFYFDSDDYENPIKTYIDDTLWFKIMPLQMKDADVYVRKNFLKLQDSYIQITGEEEDMFTSISGQRETHDDYWSGNRKFIGVYFRVDPIVSTYERQVYSSGDLLAQVGGIFSFLQSIGGILVFIFSERLLVSALAGKLYQVYDDKHDNYDDKKHKNHLDHSVNSSKIAPCSCPNHQSMKSDKSIVVDEENAFFMKNPVRNLFKNTLYCK